MEGKRLELQVPGKQERFCEWHCKCGKIWKEPTPRLDYPDRMPDFKCDTICDDCLNKM